MTGTHRGRSCPERLVLGTVSITSTRSRARDRHISSAESGKECLLGWGYLSGFEEVEKVFCDVFWRIFHHEVTGALDVCETGPWYVGVESLGV